MKNSKSNTKIGNKLRYKNFIYNMKGGDRGKNFYPGMIAYWKEKKNKIMIKGRCEKERKFK